jgi:hypothetical protein
LWLAGRLSRLQEREQAAFEEGFEAGVITRSEYLSGRTRVQASRLEVARLCLILLNEQARLRSYGYPLEAASGHTHTTDPLR